MAQRLLPALVPLFAALAVGGCGSKQSAVKSDWRYFSQDGTWQLRLDHANGIFGFFSGAKPIGEPKLTEDVNVGTLRDCSTKSMRCLALADIVFAIPAERPMPKTWTAERAKFDVVKTISSDHGTLYLVATLDGGRDRFFSYSDRRGIETISFGPTLVAKYGLTFTLDGDRGPLATHKRP